RRGNSSSSHLVSCSRLAPSASRSIPYRNSAKVITLNATALSSVFARNRTTPASGADFTNSDTTFVSSRYFTAQFFSMIFLLAVRSEEHTSELQSLAYLVCRLLLEKKKSKKTPKTHST